MRFLNKVYQYFSSASCKMLLKKAAAENNAIATNLICLINQNREALSHRLHNDSIQPKKKEQYESTKLATR